LREVHKPAASGTPLRITFEGGSIFAFTRLDTRKIKEMTFKERLESNPLYWCLFFLAVGYFAGIGTYEFVLRVAQLETISKVELKELRKIKETSTEDAPQVRTDNSKSLSTDTSPVEPLSLRTVPSVSNENIGQTLDSIHTEYSLQPLAMLESGKSIAETPNSRFFFFSGHTLKTYDSSTDMLFLTGSMSRLRKLRIPGESDHPLRFKVITDSGGKRSPVPIQSDH